MLYDYVPGQYRIVALSIWTVFQNMVVFSWLLCSILKKQQQKQQQKQIKNEEKKQREKKIEGKERKR